VLHDICVVKNVTITLSEEVARQARILAAEHDTSVSQMLGELLTEKIKTLSQYQAAGNRFLARSPRVLQETPAPYPDRESLHER
jgi:plasmid stability protein